MLLLLLLLIAIRVHVIQIHPVDIGVGRLRRHVVLDAVVVAPGARGAVLQVDAQVVDFGAAAVDVFFDGRRIPPA